MIWVGLLGASVALNRGAHLGIDYLVAKLSPRKALYVSLFVFAIIAAFSLLVMVVGGGQLVLQDACDKTGLARTGSEDGICLSCDTDKRFLSCYLQFGAFY